VSAKGGRLLRQIREHMGQPQLWVELEAELGSGYLQRVESGKVKRPLRQTLERILDALHARYSERQQILELYGYTVSIPKPDEAEIAWAQEVCQAELDAVLFPAYLLDCTHQLLAWNQQAVCLLTGDMQPPKMQGMNRVSLLRIWFDAKYAIQPRVTNPDEFFPAMIRALRNEIQLYSSEAWHQAMIDELLETIPFMKKVWDSMPQDRIFPYAGRSVAPLHLCSADDNILQFRLSAERFTRDFRFRVIYFFPADVATMQQCTQWAVSSKS
jgi:transcriptional regulator with XRE-family HTH domain